MLVRMQVLAAQLAALPTPGRASSVRAGGGTAVGGGSASGLKPEASFNNLLNEAISQASRSAPAGGQPTRIPLFPSLSGSVPAASSLSPTRAALSQDVTSYPNGRLPASLLQPVDATNRLWTPAAASYLNMVAAAARDGVAWHVNDSYRSFDQQVQVARRKGLYSQGGLAAAPGTSDHGWGRSVDLDLDERAQTWLRSHAAQYGFSADVPRESWHWTFKAKA